MLAYRLDVLADAGAYPRLGALLPMFTRMMAPGVYDIPKVESRARVVVTTTTSTGAYRGAGRPEATAAIERAMDLFAAEIGMDPAEVRRRNLVAPDKFPFTTKGGAVYDTGDYAKALDQVLEAAGYAGAARRAGGPPRARRRRAARASGVSVYVEITGGGAFAEDASVEVHPDGTVTVLTGTSPHGQGHATAWAMLASEQLGIPIEKITVKHGDTDLIPRGGGTDGLAQPADRRRRGAPGRRASWSSWPSSAPPTCSRPTSTTSWSTDGRGRGAGAPDSGRHAGRAGRARAAAGATATSTAAPPTFPFGAHVAVVEVDVESGKAVVERIVTVDDAGPVLNPLLAEGQRHGGIAQGIAQALLEEVVYDDDGNPLTATFADYAFPSAAELPSFELVEMATPTHLNPLGAKGIGEAGTIGATPAVQSAVIDAVAHLGVRHIDMPTTPLRVWTAINAPLGAGMSTVKIEITVNGEATSADVEPRLLLAHYLRDVRRAQGHQHRLRHHLLRRVHGAGRRRVGEVLHGAGRAGRPAVGDHAGGAVAGLRSTCTRWPRRSARSTGCSAASARRAW